MGLSPIEVINLANEFILDTEHELLLKQYQKHHGIPVTGEVTMCWYKGFVKRYKDCIKTKFSKNVAFDRLKWATYDNILQMYVLTYDLLVDARIAIKKDRAVFFTKEGKIAINIRENYGRPTLYHLIHPEFFLFVDETGSNTNMKDDKRIGGQTVLAGIEDEAIYPAGTKDAHFTVLVVTNALGEPVCVVIIIKGKVLSMIEKLGMDMSKELVHGSNEKDFDKNYGDGKRFPGAPVCTYLNNEIPPLVTCTPTGSVNGTILTEMLRHIDHHSNYRRGPNKPTPVLQLDGHQSRFHEELLSYTNENEDHRWRLCLGVPNATHLWQVGDASQLNGKYKIETYKYKRMLMKFKLRNKLKPQIEKYDIVPMVNEAVKNSFFIKDASKNAVAERGWNPLNYYLLDHPMLKDTSESEKNNQTIKRLPACDLSTINLSGNSVVETSKDLMQKILNDERIDKFRLDMKSQEKKNEMFDQIGLTKKLTAGALFECNKIELDRTVLGTVRKKNIQIDNDAITKLVKLVMDYSDTRKKVLKIAERSLQKAATKHPEIEHTWKSNLIGFLGSNHCVIEFSYELGTLLKFFKENEKGALPTNHKARDILWQHWKSKGDISLDNHLFNNNNVDKDEMRNTYRCLKAAVDDLLKRGVNYANRDFEENCDEDSGEARHSLTEEQKNMFDAFKLLTPVMKRIGEDASLIGKKSSEAF